MEVIQRVGSEGHYNLEHQNGRSAFSGHNVY